MCFNYSKVTLLGKNKPSEVSAPITRHQWLLSTPKHCSGQPPAKGGATVFEGGPPQAPPLGVMFLGCFSFLQLSSYNSLQAGITSLAAGVEGQ